MHIPTHFLMIGVENYNDHKNFRKVAYAQKDVTDIMKAFVGLGYDPESFNVLLDGHATKATIEKDIKKMARSAVSSERIVIYFSGHGFTSGGKNVIAPVDASHEDPDGTCITLESILGTLERAESDHNILFLDCCHSGFIPGSEVRSSTGDFSSEELVYALKHETYCVGFASCQGHQTSISDSKLENGVWSHFLKQALTGSPEAERDGIYESGVLTSEGLQNFLRHKTHEFVRLHDEEGRQQKPIQFGSLTDTFVVEDLSGLFALREAERKANAVKLTSIYIYDTEDGDIDDLPDFDKRKNHTVPTTVNSYANRFVKNKSGTIVKEEINKISVLLSEHLGYSIEDLKCETGDQGSGTIETPDFTYTVTIGQSEDNAKEYIITRNLGSIVNEQIIDDERFNRVFDRHFRKLSFYFDKSLDLKAFVSKIQPIAKKKNIPLKFIPADLTYCIIMLPGSINEIVVTKDSLVITTPKTLSPQKLIQEYRQTVNLLDAAELKLLN